MAERTGEEVQETIEPSDVYTGKGRKAAKLSVADEPTENFGDIRDLIETLPTDEVMFSHRPPISADPDSGRVAEENRNVRVDAFLYAARKEADNNFSLIIGRDPHLDPPMYVRTKVSGVPEQNYPSFSILKAARDAYKSFFEDNLPDTKYNFYSPPIPVEVEGSLYFNTRDTSGRRSIPSSLRPQLGTRWEIHPITNIVFKPDHLDPSVVQVGSLGGAGNDAAATEDQLGFSHYVEALAELIDSPYTEAPLTIGIYGSWGMGKSSLLQQLKRKLEKRKPSDNSIRNSSESGSPSRKQVHVVSFNAWEYSATEAVWPGLVRNIMNTVETHDIGWGKTKRFRKTLSRNWRRQMQQIYGPLIILFIVTIILVVLVALWSDRSLWEVILWAIGGIGALGVVGGIKLVKDSLTNPFGKWVTTLFQDSDYGRHIEYMDEISKDLKDLGNLLHKNNLRILAVVDDLDRCEPKKAVEMLQAINLLLGFRGFIVCLGIDARVITAAVEKYYEGLLGNAGASGYEYLEKIIQIPFRIPQPSEEELRIFIAGQLRGPETQREEQVLATGDTDTRPDDTTDGDPQEGASNTGGTTQRNTPIPDGDTQRNTSETDKDKPVAFTDQEIQAFQNLIPFVRPNPRHIKRLMNVYRLVRTLADAKGEQAILDKPEVTMRWLVMCDQWPYTSHVMLTRFSKLLKEYENDIGRFPATNNPLLYLLQEATPNLPEDKLKEKQRKFGEDSELLTSLLYLLQEAIPNLPEDKLKEKQRKFGEDSELLTSLLEHEGEKPTWEQVQLIRQYTVNFNPAIEDELLLLASPSQPGQGTGDEVNTSTGGGSVT